MTQKSAISLALERSLGRLRVRPPAVRIETTRRNHPIDVASAARTACLASPSKARSRKIRGARPSSVRYRF